MEVILLDIFAMISFVAGKAEEPLFEDGSASFQRARPKQTN